MKSKQSTLGVIRKNTAWNEFYKFKNNDTCVTIFQDGSIIDNKTKRQIDLPNDNQFWLDLLNNLPGDWK